MTTPSPQRRSLKRRRLVATIALVASSSVRQVASFAGATATISSKSDTVKSSSVFYTLDEHVMSSTTTASHPHRYSPRGFFNPLLVQQQQPLQQSFEDDQAVVSVSSQTASFYEMPLWLRLSKSHLVHENMENLRQAMLQSFFSETEVLKLTYAIQEASNGNASKMAGAAEFCLIMVETMEMGLNALIAAAFHYCSCVEARERSAQRLPIRGNALSYWEFRPHQGIDSFGEHALQIERDAARLKRLEVVASMVIHNANHESSHHRVTPDAKAADNLRNLYTTEAKDWRALAIRGAACLYRLRGIIKMTSPAHRLTKESNRVCREALHIYAPLASRLGMHRLKNELEHAAFSILYKRQHRTVESLLHQTRETQSIRSARRQYHHDAVNKPDIGESMQHILTQVQSEITEFLENDAVFSASVKDFTVTARVKEGYSTWKKMLRNGWDHILQVPDALALRIVLNSKKENDNESDAVTRARERALCYYAQQLCMSVWAPHSENARFKDYIANPKENGYQSLHYTASTPWNGEDWTMEIQVRSGEMHKVAEFGVASHWNYKAASKAPKMEQDCFSSATSSANHQSSECCDGSITVKEQFGKVIATHNTDAYLRSLQEWHWHQHGSPVDQEPLVIFDEASATVEFEESMPKQPFPLFEEVESRERAKRIRARTERIAPYIEALANEQSDLQRKNVFVFLSSQSSAHKDKADLMAEGTVVALPAGASVLDVIRTCEYPEEEMIVKAMTHNGSPAHLTSRLQNGDVLSIPDWTQCFTTTS